MEFYKKRDFGALISDSFAFFKENGKNYFKNYFLITGPLLILYVVLAIFGFREIFMQLFSSNINGEAYLFQEYFQQNITMLVLSGTGIAILGLIVMVLVYAFPVFYIKRLNTTGNKNIKSDEVLQDFKVNSGKLVKLVIGLLFIVTPIGFILFMFSYILMLLIIGFFLMILLIPSLVNAVNFLIFDYLTSDRRFFDSLSYAFRSQFSYQNNRDGSPFWKYWGSTIVTMIINYAVMFIFSMVPMIIFYSSLLTVPQDGKMERNPFEGTMGIILFVFYGLYMLASMIMMNLTLVNSGLQYYDSRTDLHRNIDIQEIETLGNNEA